MDNMKISEQLKDFIKYYEKLELKSYQDEALVWTIGYGHTGKDIVKGMTITQNQADIFLSNDLSKFENASDYEGASLEFQNWNKITINGEKKPSDGLSVRRYDEENIFKENIYNRTDIETYRKQLVKDKEIVIENYFLKYHNIDIKKLKITWFIPEKN